MADTMSPQEVGLVLMQAARDMGVTLTQDELAGLIAIPSRESGYNPFAYNPNRSTGDDSYGLWQINMLGKMGADRSNALGINSYKELFDPYVAAKGAIQLVLAGRQAGNPLVAWGGYKGMSNTFNVGAPALAIGKQVAQQLLSGQLQGTPDLSRFQQQYASQVPGGQIHTGAGTASAAGANLYPQAPGSGVGAAGMASGVNIAAPQIPVQTDPGTVEDVARRLYAYMGAYLDDPEIGPILRQAATEQWDQARLAGAIYPTNWWKTTAEATRQWDAESKTDPATASAKVAGQVETLRRQAAQLGLQLSDGALQQIATDSLRLGWNDAQITKALGSSAQADPSVITSATLDKYRGLAAQYGVPMADEGLKYWVEQGIINGSDDGFQTQIKAYAKSMYPTIAAAIDQGTTVQQYFDPYRQLAAKTLEIAPDSVDLSDPKWQRALMGVQQGGQRAPLSLYQWGQIMKSDPTYGWDKTKGAHDQAVSTALGVAQMFGATA